MAKKSGKNCNSKLHRKGCLPHRCMSDIIACQKKATRWARYWEAATPCAKQWMVYVKQHNCRSWTSSTDGCSNTCSFNVTVLRERLYVCFFSWLFLVVEIHLRLLFWLRKNASILRCYWSLVDQPFSKWQEDLEWPMLALNETYSLHVTKISA